MNKSATVLEPEQLQDYKLPESTLLSIAKMVIIGSELDDVLSQCIALFTSRHRPATYMMLGRTGISTKVDQLAYLYKSRGQDDDLQQFKIIEKPLRKFIQIRNLVCHGIYMGKVKATGELVFLKPAEQYEPTENFATFKSAGILEEQLHFISENSPKFVDFFLQPLGAKSLRDTHFPEFRLPK